LRETAAPRLDSAISTKGSHPEQSEGSGELQHSGMIRSVGDLNQVDGSF